MAELAEERARKSRDELDQIGLAVGSGLLVEAAQMGLDRACPDPEGLGHFGSATDVDDGEKNAKLGRRQLVVPRNAVGEGGTVHRRRVHEQSRHRGPGDFGAASRSGRQWQYACDVTFALTGDERQGDAANRACKA